MLRRILLLAFASLFLTACGRGHEDYSVVVRRPVDKVMPHFDHIAPPPEITALIPGIKFDKTQSDEDEIVYVVPGKGEFPARIALRFESFENGQFTRIHVAVDVPRIETKLLGSSKVLSESKVERSVRSLLSKSADRLEKGGSASAQTKELGMLLAVLSVVSDPDKVDRMLAIRDYPEWYLDGMSMWDIYGEGDFASSADYPAGAPVQSSRPQSNPNADVASQSWRERNARAEAAKPMDDAQGEEPVISRD